MLNDIHDYLFFICSIYLEPILYRPPSVILIPYHFQMLHVEQLNLCYVLATPLLIYYIIIQFIQLMLLMISWIHPFSPITTFTLYKRVSLLLSWVL